MLLSLAYVGMNLPYFIMAPLTGYIIDHFDKRKLMIAADLGQVICMSLMLLYDYDKGHPISALILLIFCSKTLVNCFETIATFQLIPSLVPAHSLSDANTWFLTSQRFVQIIGPLLGGILFGLLGIRVCIMINILSFFATLYFVYRLKNLNLIINTNDVEEPYPISLKAIYTDFIQSVDYIRRSKLFRSFVCLMFMWNLSPLCPNSPSLVYYFNEYSGFTSSKYGIVAALIGTVSILGFMISRTLYFKFSFFKTFVGSSLWQAIFASVAVLSIPFPSALALIFAISRAGGAILSIGTFLLRQTQIPKHRSGGINASLRMFFMFAAPLSGLLQGFIIQAYGIRFSLIFGAICLWFTVFLAQNVGRAYQEVRTLEQPPGKAAA